MSDTTTTTTSLDRLAEHIRLHGPVQTVRVSSAQARGLAGKYPYWGAVRYEVRLRQADGVPTSCALERASSDRRSERLADRDAEAIAAREGRVYCHAIGPLSDRQAEELMDDLAALDD